MVRTFIWSALLTPVVCSPTADSAIAVAPYDLDGDGRQELVAGVADLADGQVRRAGAVLVVPGSPTGLDLVDTQLISRSTDGVPGDSISGTGFGGAASSADFNADGFADLAVGSPSQTFAEDYPPEGAVTVIYGGAGGLTDVAEQFAGPAGEWEGPMYGTLFGSALAAGDLNRDGFDDLVVGAIGESQKRQSDWGSGAVHLLFGGPNGLTRLGERILHRPSRADHAFGRRLAVGDIDRDGHLDLVEGAAGYARTEDYGGIAGHLSYCPGRANAPTSCRSVGLRSRHGVSGERAREAPASLALGDVTGDGYVDIVEGVPEDHWWDDGSTWDGPPPGAILLRRGTSRGPGKRVLRIDEDTPGVPGRAEGADRFGAAVAVGRIDRDRYFDIVVGAPGENGRYPDYRSVSPSGRVSVLYGARAGVRTRGAKSYDHRTPGMKSKTGHDFGVALTLLDHDRDGRLDLTIGTRGLENEDDFTLTRGELVTLLGRHGGFDNVHAIGIDWSLLGVRRQTETALGTVIGR